MSLEVGKRYVWVNARAEDDPSNGQACTLVDLNPISPVHKIFFPGYVSAQFDEDPPNDPTPVRPEELTPLE